MKEQTEEVQKDVEVHEEAFEKKAFDFSDEFQKKIAQAILVDHKFAQQIYEVLEINYFRPKWLKVIIGEHKTFFQKYGGFPSFEVLSEIVTEKYLKSDKGKTVAPLIKEFLLDSDLADLKELKFVKEKTLEFCRKQLMQEKLIQAVNLLGQGDGPEKYDKISNIVNKATMAGSETTKGMSLEEDIDARYISQKREPIPTGVPELDAKEHLNGGLGKGEIGIVAASSGAGKSHWLTQFGAGALKEGKNVIHFTFELKESMVAIRYDSNLVDIPSLYCPENIDSIKDYYSSNKQLGKLRIKFYNMGTATCNTLRSYLDKLQSTEGIKPDLILVDYVGVMRSTERHESLRHELKAIVEELRTLANDYQCPLWTAAQTNRDGVDADFIEINDLSESFGMIFAADVALGWTRKPEEKSTGIGTLRIMKNRAGNDGINLPMVLDTSRSKAKALIQIGTNTQNLSSKERKDIAKEDVRDFVSALQNQQKTRSYQ